MKTYIAISLDGKFKDKRFDNNGDAITHAAEQYKWFHCDARCVVVEDDPQENGSWKPERSHDGMRIIAEFYPSK